MWRPICWTSRLLIGNKLIPKIGLDLNRKCLTSIQNLLKINYTKIPKLQFHSSGKYYNEDMRHNEDDRARLKRIEELTRRLGLDKQENKPFWQSWIDSIIRFFTPQSTVVPEYSHKDIKRFSMKNISDYVKNNLPNMKSSGEPIDPYWRSRPDFAGNSSENPKMKLMNNPTSRHIEEHEKDISKWGVKEISRSPDGTQIVKFSPLNSPDFGKMRQYLLHPEECQSSKPEERCSQSEPLPKNFDDDLLLCCRRKECVPQPIPTCPGQDCIPRCNSRFKIEKKHFSKPSFFTKFTDLKNKFK